MYAGIVVDKYGKVPEHVKGTSGIKIYDLDKGVIEKTISLDGIDKERFAGWRVAREASDNNVDYLYTGKELKILRIPILPRLLGFRKMENKARPGSSISDIVKELHGTYQLKKPVSGYQHAA
jgi:hypothetical protein